MNALFDKAQRVMNDVIIADAAVLDGLEGLCQVAGRRAAGLQEALLRRLLRIGVQPQDAVVPHALRRGRHDMVPG